MVLNVAFEHILALSTTECQSRQFYGFDSLNTMVRYYSLGWERSSGRQSYWSEFELDQRLRLDYRRVMTDSVRERTVIREAV